MANRLVHKQPSEDLPLDFDFEESLSAHYDTATLDSLTIASVEALVVDPTGDASDLDLGTAGAMSLSGLKAQARMTKGRDGIAYHATCRVVLSNGDKPELDGWIVVREE